MTLSAGDNTLRESLVGALTTVLKRLESNPTVTMVILAGSSDKVFSSGSALAGMLSKAKEDKAGKGLRRYALALLRREYALHSLIANYGKPIVSCMQGLASGSGWALGAHAPYSYASDSTAIVLDEISNALPPLGGSSYHLSRMPAGVGLWASLTGSVVSGVDAYHAGFANLYGSGKDLRKLLPVEAGVVSASVPTGERLDDDDVWNAAQDTLVSFRSFGKLEHLANNNPLGDELPEEVVDEYWGLKRWYTYWKAGDMESANLSLGGVQHPMEEWGDAFDIGQGKSVWMGRGEGERHPGSYRRAPPHAAAARRSRIGATSAHAAALWSGALDPNPSQSFKSQLQVIETCFSGGNHTELSTGPIHSVSSSPTRQERLALKESKKAEILASLVANPPPLPSNWEDAKLGGNPALVAYVREALEYLGLEKKAGDSNSQATSTDKVATPEPANASGHPLSSSSPAIPPPSFLLQMVRLGVESSWPKGSLSDSAVVSIVSRFLRGGATGAIPGGALGHAQVTALLTVSVARVVAALHGLTDSTKFSTGGGGVKSYDPWVLLDSKSSSVALVRAPSSSSSRKPVGDGDGHPDSGGYFRERDPLLEGERPGTWVPWVENESSDGPTSSKLSLYPDEVFYGGHEAVLNDGLFFEHFGQWEGSILMDEPKDSIPITPFAVDVLGPGMAFPMALSPVFSGDIIKIAPTVARSEFLSLLYTGIRTVNPYVVPALGLSSLSPEYRVAVKEKTVYSRWGAEWDAKEKRLVQMYFTKAKEGKGGSLLELQETSDLSGFAWQARAHLVWPHLMRLTQYARIMIIKALCLTSGVNVSPLDMRDFVNYKLDIPESLEILSRQRTPRSIYLVNLWGQVVSACTPRAGEHPGGVVNPASPVPHPHLNEKQTAYLNRLAIRWAELESVWLEEGTGGEWTAAHLNTPGNPKKVEKFTLAVTRDASIGGQHRLALLPQGFIAPTSLPTGTKSKTATTTAYPKTLAEARSRLAAALSEEGSKSGISNAQASFWGSGKSSIVGEGKLQQQLEVGAVSSQGTGESNLAEDEEFWEVLDPSSSSSFPTPPSHLSGSWDYDFVLSALSSPTGHGVAAIFGLPSTTPMLKSGEMAAGVFQREARGRVSNSFPSSVEEIKGRLATISKGDPSTEKSAFAATTLSRLESLPGPHLHQTFSCITMASKLSLAQCMAMEYRAVARITGAAPPGSLGETLTPPFLELPLSSQRGTPLGVKSAMKRRTDEGKWLASHEAYLASGEAAGVVGDHFRRRYVYEPASLNMGDEDAEDREEKLLREESQIMLKGVVGGSTSGAYKNKSETRRSESVDLVDEIAKRAGPGDIELLETQLRDLDLDHRSDDEEDGASSAAQGGYTQPQKTVKLLARRGAQRALSDATEIVMNLDSEVKAKAASKNKNIAGFRGVPVWLQ